MEFVPLTNDIAELSGVVILTSADIMLDTDGRDCSFNEFLLKNNVFLVFVSDICEVVQKAHKPIPQNAINGIQAHLLPFQTVLHYKR